MKIMIYIFCPGLCETQSRSCAKASAAPDGMYRAFIDDIFTRLVSRKVRRLFDYLLNFFFF